MNLLTQLPVIYRHSGGQKPVKAAGHLARKFDKTALPTRAATNKTDFDDCTTTWAVLRNEQWISIFPTKWRANEQQGEG